MRRSIQRFEVRTQLGEGGMGTVYRAHDPQLERDVAIKVLRGQVAERSELSTDHTVDLRGEGAQSVLLREARMMARLSHPNVVPVYEVGLDGDAVFVVMEHVDGLDLRDWLKRGRTMTEVLRVFAQAADGLAAAHARGIIHRDFKPDNVLIGADGRARVADFGLSRLVSRDQDLVRVSDTAGTPRYMAPELWDGATATPASDTFAYCVSLAEMLGCDARLDLAKQLAARKVPRRVRALVVAGAAQDPAERPDIGQFAVVLQARASGRAVAVAAGLAAATGVLAVGAALRMRRAEAPSCAVDPALSDGRWNEAAKTALRERYRSSGEARVDQMFAAVDAVVAQLGEAHREVCLRAREGDITEAQAAMRRSCLERRAMEIGARARHYAVLEPRPSLEVAEEYVSGVWQYEVCDVVNAPPLPEDPALRVRIEALHARHWQVFTMTEAEATVPIAALHKEALELRQHELAVSLGVTLAARLTNLERLDDSSRVLAETSALATEVANPQFEVMVLLERSTLAHKRAEHEAARQLAQLALEKAKKPGFAPRTRVVAYIGLAYAHIRRGDPVAALDTARAGLADVAKHGRMVVGELGLRVQVLNALEVLGRYPEQLAFAEESTARSRAMLGPNEVNHAVMLDRLGRAQQNAGQPEKSLATRQEALAVLRKHYGPEHTRVVSQEIELANDLSYGNRLVEAHAICERAVATADRVGAAFDGVRGWYVARLAETTFDLGRHGDAIRAMERALELLGAQQGIDHPSTLYNRTVLGDYRMELGRLDDAQRDFDAVAASYKRRPEPNDRRGAILRGQLYAPLALARGKATDAEQLGREALAELVERKATDDDQRLTKQHLGSALVALGRAPEAIPLLEEVVAVARRTKAREDQLAIAELELARAELATGKRDAGLARARRAQAMLARWPGCPKARASVAKLLADTK